MTTNRSWGSLALRCLLLLLLVGAMSDEANAKKKKKNKKVEDPYADYVWPPPPDDARIKLEWVGAGRADVEAVSGFRRKLLSVSPQSAFDELKKPFGVAFDNQGRILVTDPQARALLRFDREDRQLDVLGTKGPWSLTKPMGLSVGPDDTIYVADGDLARVLALSPDGKVVSVYGKQGELTSPTDAEIDPTGSRLFVADSPAHKIVVFDAKTAEVVSTFGRRGNGDGEFNYPTSLAFDPEGNLFVVDQLNARVQMFEADGEYVDQFGERGLGFGNLNRPKDIAIDETGFIYVTDFAFNNVQLFDVDFALLTFVGSGGTTPGKFHGASGVAVRGDEFAVVDQLGRRVQVFRFIVPKED